MELTYSEIDDIERHGGLLNYARAVFLNRIKSPYRYKRVNGILYYTFKPSLEHRAIGARPFGWHRVV